MDSIKNKKVLTLFDADFILFTATMGNKCLDEEGNPIRIDNKFTYIDKTEEEVYSCADSIIATILELTSADYYIGYLGDCKSFRYESNPEYKANRKNLVKPLFFNELKKYLNSKWNFQYTVQGLEADDAVNIVRNNFKNDLNCIIVSSDKDLIKCIEGKYINSRNLEYLETSLEEAKDNFWRSMICGDRIDNILGLPGRGDKFVDKLFELNEDKRLLVFGSYLTHFDNEEEAIENFYKNYKCLKILDNFSNFALPELNPYTVKLFQDLDSL